MASINEINERRFFAISVKKHWLQKKDGLPTQGSISYRTISLPLEKIQNIYAAPVIYTSFK
jgi:hypothetical protein